MTISTLALSRKGREAVRLAEQGIWVLPCVPDGKKPIRDVQLGLEHGYKDASNDPVVNHTRWLKHPDGNPAVVTGEKNALAVADLDWRNGADLESLPREWRQTPIILTPNGCHLYYHHDGPLKTYAELDGIGMKGDGGYVVAPPSTRPEGTYEVFKAVPMMGLPVGLLDRFTPERVYQALPDRARQTVDRQRTRGPIRVGHPRAWADAALANQQHFLLVAKTNRNNQLFISSFTLGQIVEIGWLHEDFVVSTLSSAAVRVGLDAWEILPTIHSGLSRGRLFPRQII